MGPVSTQTFATVRRWLRGQPTATRLIELDAEPLFAIVSDVRFHSRWVPLTHIKAPLNKIKVGDTFTANTLGIRDRMTLTSIEDGVAQFRKDGPFMVGSAEIRVEPVAPGVGRVTWSYDAMLAGPLPSFVARALAGLALAPVLRFVIDRMEADILANKHRIG